jgi:hydroxyethylthiazole kinase-like uncharacterized protein yjeF
MEARMAGHEVLLTVEEMRRAESAASGGGSTLPLMRAAGRAVASAAQAVAPQGRILVIAGRGNNGGDGFVAARHLRETGREVAVMLLCARETLRGDAATVAAEWDGPVLAFDPGALGGCSLLIDAIFGAGLDRPIKGVPADLIEAINAGPIPVLSVDLPSGINADTGAVMGCAIRARHTVTFFRRKPGHLLLPGRQHCGRVQVADIGVGEAVLDSVGARTVANGPELWRGAVPVPQLDGHKYSRGHAVVVSGGASSTGAARLAARGALRVGAGLVSVASPHDALAINAAALTAIMVRLVDSPDDLRALLSDRRIVSLVIGPGSGVGERTRAMVLAAAGAGRALVLDADALTSFAESRDSLIGSLQAAGVAVLTPHYGEFARLFPDLASLPSKLDKARRAAALSHAIVVLKGPDTVVAAPDGRAAIAGNAPPWLATAGSGDVLSGIIAGLLAQGVPGFDAASMGVWLHGEAGLEFGPGLIAEDLPEAMPAVLRRLFAACGAGQTTA